MRYVASFKAKQLLPGGGRWLRAMSTPTLEMTRDRGSIC